jgi:hypothetical protein
MTGFEGNSRPLCEGESPGSVPETDARDHGNGPSGYIRARNFVTS